MEYIGVKGILTLHQLPADWSDEELRYWWEPKTAWDEKRGWVIVRPARMSDERKAAMIVPLATGERYKENLITNLGIANILNNIGVASQGNQQPLAQILSVGNGAISGVARADTSVSGDGFTSGARKVPASNTTVGFTTTIVTNYGSGDGVGTWTNIGLYGFAVSGAANATTSSGTGALMTHALYSFVKGATAYAVNYVMLLSN